MEAEAARRRRKGSEILPPNSASTDSSASSSPFPFQFLLNTPDLPKILPSRRNQKLNVVAFISCWCLHPLFPTSLPPSLFILFLHGRLLQPSFWYRLRDVSVSTVCFSQVLWHFYPVKHEPLDDSRSRGSSGWKYYHLGTLCLSFNGLSAWKRFEFSMFYLYVGDYNHCVVKIMVQMEIRQINSFEDKMFPYLFHYVIFSFPCNYNSRKRWRENTAVSFFSFLFFFLFFFNNKEEPRYVTGKLPSLKHVKLTNVENQLLMGVLCFLSKLTSTHFLFGRFPPFNSLPLLQLTWLYKLAKRNDLKFHR